MSCPAQNTRIEVANLKTGVLTEPALVGREKELEELETFLDEAVEGKGRTIFISGEAGSGKTRLTKEFLKRAQKKAATVLSGWCISDTTVPYFPFATAFDTYFSSDSEETFLGNPQLGIPTSPVKTGPSGLEGFGITAWLAGMKPPGRTMPEAPSPQVWKDQLFAAVGKTLHSIAVQLPVILLLEDIHWADSASLSLLHYLCRLIRTEKILIIATYRSEELTADAEGRPHPLVDIMRLIKRDELFFEISLSNLNQTDITKVVENLMGGNVQPSLIEKLSKESSGNALFVIESLRMLAERKSLVQENNQWRLAVDELTIPSKIKDIILRRLGLLKSDQRRLLDAASVIGEKFNVELLRSVLGQDILDVLETLTVISRSTLLVSTEGNLYKFDHAKSRETLYSEIPSPLRTGYHTRIAERLENTGKNGKLPLSDLSYHYAQAGNAEKATKYALEAGQDELAKFSNAEASKHFKYVLDTTPETIEHKNDRLKALEGLGDALYAMSALEEAAKVFEQLSKTAELGTIKLRALRKASVCLYWIGNIDYALEVAGKAEAFAQSDRLEHARLSLFRGFIEGRSGRSSEAIRDMEQALQTFEEEYSSPDVAQALVELTFVYRMKNRASDAFVSALRSIPLFEELEDLRGLALAYNRVAGPLMEFDLNQNALEYIEKSKQLQEKIGDYNLLALNYWVAGQIFGQLKDTEKASTQFLKGIEYARRTNGYYVQTICYTALISQYTRFGDLEHAEEIAGKFTKILEDVPTLKNNPMVRAMTAQNNSNLQYARGQIKEAAETLESALKNVSTAQSSTPSQMAGLKRRLSRILERQGRTEEAKTYLEEAQQIRKEIAEEHKQADFPRADLMAKKEIGVGEELNVRLDIVNTTKASIRLLNVTDLIPAEFKVIAAPSYSEIQSQTLELKQKELKPYSVEPIKLTTQITKPGTFKLTPQIIYMEETGETKTLQPPPITITAQPTLHLKTAEKTLTIPVIPNRITTGFANLDALLFGGIPERCAVVLASPSIDERELLTRRFLEVGTKAGETTFYLTADPYTGKNLASQYPSTFYLFNCSAQPDPKAQNAPNIYKLKGVENLTEIDIALTKAFRTLNQTQRNKRAILEMTSDVLLQHHAITTRRWLSSLLPTLKLKGFTILAVINPQMHPPEEVQAILSLFEGEIRITEKETTTGSEKTIRVAKLYNQKYLNQEITLTKEQLLEDY